MDYNELVSYENIADKLEYHELIVRRMWKLLHQFKRDCRQVLNLIAVKETRNLGSAGPLEVEFYFETANQIPPSYMLAAMIDAHFEFLEFPTTYHLFYLCRDPDSDEITHQGFCLQISYWGFSDN